MFPAASGSRLDARQSGQVVGRLDAPRANSATSGCCKGPLLAMASGVKGSYREPTSGDRSMTDPIVDEVRRVRDAHAAVFNYDLDAIFRDIKEQEKKSGLKFVSYPPRRVAPNQPERITAAPLAGQ